MTIEKEPDGIDTTTEMDTEYDVIVELKDSLNDIYQSIQESKLDGILDKVSYSRFLAKEIDDTFSGEEYKKKRHRRFILNNQ